MGIFIKLIEYHHSLPPPQYFLIFFLISRARFFNEKNKDLSPSLTLAS